MNLAESIKIRIIMNHRMHLMDKPFQMIKSKYKTIELRLCDEKRKHVKKGDTIEFINLSNEACITVMVEDVKKYNDFETLYKNHKKESMGYLEDEIANPNDMLLYYHKEDMHKYGVLAIQVSVIS
jgi:ASC-1-like (ASCH) protein